MKNYKDYEVLEWLVEYVRNHPDDSVDQKEVTKVTNKAYRMWKEMKKKQKK